MILADAIDNVNPAFLWQLIQILVAAAMVSAVVIQIMDRRKVQERRVSFETEFATRGALEEVRADVEAVDGKVEALKGEIIRNGDIRRMAIETKVEEARREARECADELRREIGQTRDEVKELVGETRIINQNFAQLSMEVRNRSAREVGK